MKKQSIDLSIILSFVVSPVILASILFIHYNIYPFGTKTILTYDLSYQFVEFFALFRRMITEGHSLQYSWQLGLGSGTTAWFAYYMMTPFTLLVLLFPEKLITEAILLMLLGKISFSGGFFALFLRKVWQTDKFATVLFSSLYALSAYAIGYFHLILFLDALWLLPLMLILLEKLIKTGQWRWFSIGLTVMFLIHFYSAFYTGIFIFLYFIAALFRQRIPKADVKRLVGKFTLSVFAAFGMSAFLLVPTILYMRGHSLMIGQSIPVFTADFNLFEFTGQLFGGSFTGNDGTLPHIYCGVICILLIPLFFLNRLISFREKLSLGTLAMLLCLIMSNQSLDFFMHGFDRPNGYPFRYSFLFSFCIVLIACRGFVNLKGVSIKQIGFSGLSILILLNLIHALGIVSITDKTLAINSMICVSLTLLLMGLITDSGKKVWIGCSCLIPCICAIENITNDIVFIDQTTARIPFEDRIEFRKVISEYGKALQESPANTFSRTEIAVPRSTNDNMLLGTNSVSTFSSVSDNHSHRLIEMLGVFTAAQECDLRLFKGATPPVESLFGVNTVLSEDPDSRIYEKEEIGEIFRFTNKDAMPLGFSVSSSLLGVQPNFEFDKNPFELLETIYSEMAAESTRFFYPVDNIIIDKQNLSMESDDFFNWIKKTDISESGELTFTLTVPENGPYFAYFPARETGKYAEVFVNDELQTERYFREPRPYILDLGTHQQGESISISISLDSDELTLINQPYFFQFDQKAFSAAAEKAAAFPMEIESFTDTQLIGQCSGSADRKLLFTTIPYDSNWHATVNGKSVNTLEGLGAFITIPLSDGNNEIELRFQTEGLLPGSIISFATLLILIISACYKRNPNRENQR